MKPIRIANAGGYWGDDPYALRRQLEGSLKLDFISIDFLAEITMSILQKSKLKDSSLGYARDFLQQIESVLPLIVKQKIKVITNAGGVNPQECARQIVALGHKLGFPELRVAVVEGDDIQSRLPDLSQQGIALNNMETGDSYANIAGRVLAANVYFGAKPVALALEKDPHIVVTGRVTDTGITLAAMIHSFGWKEDDYHKLASGIVAGHIIECGAQATGGNFTDWKKVPSFQNMGYPIVEVYPDGSFFVTKHPETGGLVSCQTVREQLLYEMGEPQAYITPDVIADFSTIELEPAGENRVKVSGVKGTKPTDLLKVSMAYSDGYKCTGTLIISGPDALAKSQVFSQNLWKAVDQECLNASLPLLEHRLTEFVGYDATHGTLTPDHTPSEILLRLGVRGHSKEAIAIFRKLVPAQILSGPAGVAVTGGAPVISDVVSYWPCLIPQDCAPSRVILVSGAGTTHKTEVVAESLPWPVTQGQPPQKSVFAKPKAESVRWEGPFQKRPLMAIAHARSGDKGDTANIGLIGRSFECYLWIRENISADFVKQKFNEKCLGNVNRTEVENLWALNFLLEESLGGGGTMSLNLDAQGKTYSQALLRCEVEIPVSVLKSISPENAPCAGELWNGMEVSDNLTGGNP
jgi:hypothetical protein